jgi:SagB-type dehydrogenase family enzyme
MNTLTKLALGLMGQLKPRPVEGEEAPRWVLPAPSREGGMPLLNALRLRQSQRTFAADALPEQQLSDLLWAAGGVNRPELGGRTVPSAMNAQELQIYVALPQGLYRYRPVPHELERVAQRDVRPVTGYQDFVDDAALDLVYIADHSAMSLVAAERRTEYAFATAGATAQNVYLYCASAGLATVVRAWFDRAALSEAIGLGTDEQLLLTQTVGKPASR